MRIMRYWGLPVTAGVCLTLSGCAFIGSLFGGGDAGGIEIITRPHAGVMQSLDVEDTLQLMHREDGGVDFKLSLIADATHECRVAGTALPAAGGFEYRPPDPADAAASQCVLRLHRDAEGWHLTDAGDYCAASFCGNGMKIHGIVFRAAPSPLK